MKKQLLIILLISLSFFAFAQQGDIVYTDYEEDFSIHFDRFNWMNDRLPIDLNCDSVPEFEFKGVFSTHNCILVHLEATDTVTGGWWTEEYRKWRLLYRHEYFIGDSLVIGDPIAVGDTLSLVDWGNEYATPEHFYKLPDPDFPPPGSGYFAPHFIGIRHQVGDDFYYGWMEASVSIQDVAEPGEPSYNVGNYADVTVYRMTFCNIPNYPLRVGQTSFNWDTEENTTSAFATIRPNPTNGEITINGKDLKSATVFNALGQCIATAEIKGDQLKLNLSSQPTGVYFINVTDHNDKRCVKKLVKQ